MRRLMTMLTLSAALAACDGGDATEPATVVLEIGTGKDGFEPILPDDTPLFTEGIQGGYHIWGAMRTSGIDRLDVRMHFELRQDDEVIGEITLVDDMLSADGDAVEYWAVTVVLFDRFPPETVAGKETTLYGTIRDRTGITGEAQTTFVPACCDLLDDDI